MIDESIIKEQKQNKAVDDYLDEIDYMINPNIIINDER